MTQACISGPNVQLICTVTPASSNSEETHNTLKFAHRAKHIEIQAAQNKVFLSPSHFERYCMLQLLIQIKLEQIIDEKSLIKKYQSEIRLLKEELEQLKKGILSVPERKGSGGEDIVLLKQKVCMSLLNCCYSCVLAEVTSNF